MNIDIILLESIYCAMIMMEIILAGMKGVEVILEENYLVRQSTDNKCAL